MAEVSSFLSFCSKAVTPSAPPPKAPTTRGRPMSTAFAPSARYLSTSAPVRTPPSARSTPRPRTGLAISGNTSAAPGAWSSTRPPWLETTIAAAPASKAMTASSGVMTPLTMKGSLVAATSSASSANDFGETGWPLSAMTSRPAPSTSMPTAAAPAASALASISLTASWARGLTMGMPQPPCALMASTPLPYMAGSAPSPHMPMVPAASAPSMIMRMKTSSASLPPML